MAETTLSDVIVPEVFSPYVIQRTKALSAILGSNLVAQSAQFDALAKAEGAIGHIPHWNDLGTAESNVGSDNPGSSATPEKITAGKQIYVKNRRNMHFTAMDLVAPLAGSDPMQAIGNLVADRWARDVQKTLIAILQGVLADNDANDGDDMFYSVATDAAGAPAAAELISGDKVINAWATMGDASADIEAIGLHSVVYHRLQANELIEYEREAETGLMIARYLGKRVIVDDGLPAVAGTNRITYTSVLFGAGAFAYGEGMPVTPTAVDRDELAGDGEGMETLSTRKHYILHPKGFSFTSSSVAGDAPTNAEHATAANYDRVFERKACPLAFLLTNG